MGKYVSYLAVALQVLFCKILLTPTTTARHGIYDLLESHDEVRKVYKESVGQIVQIARLSPRRTPDDKTPKPNNMIVANTHLFYHPMAGKFVVCHNASKH
jgi:hypothetical protein